MRVGAAAILLELRCHRAIARLQEGRLRVSAPPGALSEPLLAAVAAHRLEIAKLLRAEAAVHASAAPLEEAVEAREHLGAVLVRSDGYGEAWLVVDACMLREIAAEEAGRAKPRPVLLA